MKIDFLKKEIWDLMRTIQVSKDTVMCPVAKDYCITPLQLRILMEIKLSEDLSLNRLAKVMDMNNGNVSTICKKLEQQGYLTRERRADDERFITLKLTPVWTSDSSENGAGYRKQILLADGRRVRGTA